MEPADPAQVEQALERYRYTWQDAELPVDDLLLSEKGRHPTEISTEAAIADVERLFYLFSHGYSGYGFFDDGDNWQQAKHEIVEELGTSPRWPVRDMPSLFARHLEFIRDCHLTIGDHHFADHMDWWYDKDIEARKDPDGYRVNVHGTLRKLTAINGEDPAHFIYPSLNAAGEATYRIGCLAKDKPADLTLDIIGSSGPEKLAIALERSNFDHFGWRRFKREEIGGVPVVRVRSFSDRYWKQLEHFVETAPSLKDTPVVIVDVRGNHGGNERWPIEWIQGMTGSRAESLFIFSELRSRTAMVGRANAMNHWLSITPDSDFLKKQAKYHRELVGELRDGRELDAWTDTRFPDTAGIPNRTTIVVITNGLVASAGEGFVMRVSRLENVVTVGENTRGALTFGNVSLHRLPNSGLEVWMPINFGLFPDLKFREEVGLEPDYWVPAGDALNAAVAAIRNGTIATEIPLTDEMQQQEFIPEDVHHVRRKIHIVGAFLLIGFVWVVITWRKRGHFAVPGCIWITIGAIWMVLGPARGKALLGELGAGFLALGVLFLAGSVANRLSKRKRRTGRAENKEASP